MNRPARRRHPHRRGGPPDLLGHGDPLLEKRVRHHDDELVSAEARLHIVRAAVLTQNSGHGDEDPVSRLMSVGVVEGLEEVDVEEGEGETFEASPEPREFLAEPLLQVQAVRQARQRVAPGETLELADPLQALSARGAGAQRRFDRPLHEPEVGEGLDQVVGSAAAQGLDRESHRSFENCREDDHADVGVDLLDGAKNVDPVHPRHPDVGDDDIVAAVAEGIHGAPAVVPRLDLVTGARQEIGDQAAGVVVVVDHQDPRAHPPEYTRRAETGARSGRKHPDEGFLHAE